MSNTLKLSRSFHIESGNKDDMMKLVSSILFVKNHNYLIFFKLIEMKMKNERTIYLKNERHSGKISK